MVHRDDPDAGLAGAHSGASGSGSLDFPAGEAPIATSVIATPSRTDEAYPAPSFGSAYDWTVAPGVQIFFVLLTVIAVPLFIYRLTLRLRNAWRRLWPASEPTTRNDLPI